MVNAKAKLVIGGRFEFEKRLNDFISTIDVRQIVKIQYAGNSTSDAYSCIVFYVNFEDIRDVKLDNILEIKD